MARPKERKLIPKVGAGVWVCYDGKRGRKCRGVITKRISQNKFEVTFMVWAGDGEIVTMPAKKVNCYYGEGYVSGYGEGGIMRSLGIAGGDYYSVHPLSHF